MSDRPRSVRDYVQSRLQHRGSSPAPPNDHVQQINIAELRSQNPKLDAAMNDYSAAYPPAQKVEPVVEPEPIKSRAPVFDPETRDTSQDVQQFNISELREQYPDLDAVMGKTAMDASQDRDFLGSSPADLRATEIFGVPNKSGESGKSGPELG